MLGFSIWGFGWDSDVFMAEFVILGQYRGGLVFKVYFFSLFAWFMMLWRHVLDHVSRYISERVLDLNPPSLRSLASAIHMFGLAFYLH